MRDNVSPYTELNISYVASILFQVDLSGFLNFWGITIDTVVAVQLILAIGLAVDYSVHIGHTFLLFSGSRNGKSNCSGMGAKFSCNFLQPSP